MEVPTMSYADPQSITVNAVPKSLPRTSTGETQSVYKTADDEFLMRISHQKTKSRMRRMVRIDQQVIAADPLTAENTYQTAGVYIVIDEPDFGFSDTVLGYLVSALTAWLAAGTNTSKLLGSET